ncbi:kinase-like protein [Paxillus ammoniavirescens]|nr:kinase-like protein [Paxillus ammoniavirescens]
MVKRELGIWRRLDHKNIVPFLGTATGFGLSGCVALVSLWMPNGTLQKFLDEHDGKLAIARRFELLLGISSGLLYLHSFPIIHGDLNSNNVLIDETFSARLADFGYASVVGEMEQNMAYLQASMQRPGAVRWAAPEQVLDDVEMTWEPTPLSDIYSFGNVVLQVLSGKQPWSEMRSDVVVLLQLAKGVNPSRPQSRPIDDEHWKFIQQCWLPVQERPPATHLVPKLQHFLNRINCPYDITDRIIRSDDQPCHRSSFGYVYRCEYRSDSGLKKVAVKVVEYNIELEEEKTRGDDRDKTRA